MSRCIERALRGLGVAWLAAVAAVGVRGFDPLTDESGIYVVVWERGTIPMVNNLDDTIALTDGTTEHDSTEAALVRWNEVLGNVQFTWTDGTPGAVELGNGVNEIARAATVPGFTFGGSTLAVTLSFRDGNYRTESDVVFNNAFSWDSYRGSKQPDQPAYDMRRVALHELGHVLGLDHPDQARPVQSVTAIMNSTVSAIDALQADDVAGGHYLYGAPNSPPANDNFADAVVITLGVDHRASVSGSTVQAGSEAGEPLLDADFPSGRSAWWTWTATADGLLNATTLGSRFDTFMGAFTGTAVDALEEVASNDDVDPGVIRTSTLSFRVPAGTRYHFLVDGWDGYEGAVQLNLELLPDAGPSIVVAQPRIVGARGEPVTLAVTATAEQGGALSYQWHRDNRPIAGANATDLTLPNFTNEDAGVYAIEVVETGGQTRWGLVYLLPDYDDTELVAWGGADTDGKRQLPALAQPALQVEVGGAHGLALLRDGTVVGWGSPSGLDLHGQETPPEGLADVVAIAAGDLHSLALRADGTVVAWGSNEYEQCLVPWDLRDVVAIAAGAYYSAALRADGTVVIWGYGTEEGGELAVPEDVVDVVALSGGLHFLVAQRADGSVRAWGDSNDGKLVVPDPLPAVAQLSAGYGHALVLTEAGAVVGWGSNDFGETTVPTDLEDVAAVDAGFDFSVAVRRDGTVAAWGKGTNNETSVPAGLDGVVQVESGRAVTVALRDLSAPVIVSETGSRLIAYGQSTTLTVEAIGANLRYQWYVGEGGDTTEPIAGAVAATLEVTPELTTSYWVRTYGAGAAADSGTYVVEVTPAAPAIVTAPTTHIANEGDDVQLAVSAVGTPPLSFQWLREGEPIAGATSATLVLDSSIAASGRYAVTVSNAHGSATTESVWVGILPSGSSERATQSATHAEGAWTVIGRVEWIGEASEVRWQWLLPSGAVELTQITIEQPLAATRPDSGESVLAEWTWTDGLSGSVELSASLAPTSSWRGVVELVGAVQIVRSGGATELLAAPDPVVLRGSIHSADTDDDHQLSLTELLRVIELYNTRSGTTRTGRYQSGVATVDGFAPATGSEEPSTTTLYHSADTNRDAQLDLTELLRVIELYNTRSGTTRTGAYRVDPTTADGFAPDT